MGGVEARQQHIADNEQLYLSVRINERVLVLAEFRVRRRPLLDRLGIVVTLRDDDAGLRAVQLV